MHLLICSNKGVLTYVKGIFPISHETVSEIKKLLLPTPNQEVKSIAISSRYPLDQFFVRDSNKSQNSSSLVLDAKKGGKV